ncbi:MAG: beta-lactamase family protein [Candidatus Aminicenantes bacterium]|nr:beta-lactamase family protein [Candidatus Aminicenantes bacterium]
MFAAGNQFGLGPSARRDEKMAFPAELRYNPNVKMKFKGAVLAAAALAAAAACDPQGSLTQKRIRTVERGLSRTVYLQGLAPEKLKLEDRMNFYRVPGVSLAVIDGRSVAWARAYGRKDAPSGQPMTTETLAQAGAFSQMIAAAVVFQLAEEGRLGLDDEVRRHLKSWSFPPEAGLDAPRLTIRRLLTHSAGLSDQPLPGYQRDDPIPTLSQMLDGEPPARNGPLWIPPVRGSISRTRYAEAGFVILEQLLEDAAGKPFDVLARELVFEPLGLGGSLFEPGAPGFLEGRAAAGHLREGRPVAGGWENYPNRAAAGLWTNPTDIAAFLVDLLRSAAEGKGVLLSTASARRLLSAQVESFGFGFLVEGPGDDILFKLRGKTSGFSAYLALYPAKAQGAVLMANSDNGHLLIEEMLCALSAAYDWPHFRPQEKQVLRLDPETYASFVGRYEVDPSYVLDVRWEDYYLVIEPTGQTATRFYAEGQSLFYATDPYVRIQFLKDREGRVAGLRLWQQDFELEAKKTS